MASHAHHSHAHSRKARVRLATVSSTRTLQTDKGGPVLARLLAESGHTVLGREILPDDPARVRARLLEWVDDPEVDAVVLTGGTGISRDDGTFDAVAGVLDKTLPGFGELFRMLSYAEIGSAAMLSRAVGGVCRGTIVFAVPGSPAACELAAGQLIAPELGHLVYELGKEGTAAVTPLPEPEPEDPAEEAPRLEGGLHLGGMPEEALAAADPDAPEAPLEGWFAALAELGGTLVRSVRHPVPEALSGLAAANQVLESAGEHAQVQLPAGDYSVFGWPDLRRPDAQVLLIGAGEIVALHRQPAGAGIVAQVKGGVLVHAGRLGRTAEERTGRDYPGEGRLFAVDGSLIYVRDGDRVTSWDGKRVREQGTTGQVTASLLLGWSQR
jgi:molybdopterin adenylyltransferase